MTKDKIDTKYLQQANALEVEFFDIVDAGLPSQHRVLKDNAVELDFNQRHGEIWRNHEVELIASDFMKAPVPPEPVRDLEAEIEELKANMKAIKTKLEIE